MIPQVLRHLLAGVEALLDLRVRDVAGHDQRAGQRQAGLDRMLGKLGQDLRHRPRQVDLDGGTLAGARHAVGLGVELRIGDLGQEPARVEFELLEEHALGGVIFAFA